MSAASLRPVAFSVLSKPVDIASNAVNTATTPASPTTMTSDGAQREGKLRMLSPVMASACLNKMNSPCPSRLRL